MRVASLILILSTVCAAEDVVRLQRGGELTGRVVAQSDKFVVLEMASGEIRIAASDVAAVERGKPDLVAAPRKIRRDEWFFLLKEERIVGWRRLLHWEQGDRVQVEERRALFADRSDRRRVEIARKDGTPLEYLWIEGKPGDMQVWSGQIRDGRHIRQTRKDGTIETASSPWTKGVQLPLIARAGAPVFDPRSNRSRSKTESTSASNRVEPGANWPGRILPTTQARVSRAVQLFARPDVQKIAMDAKLHPLTPRPEDRTVHHLAGGVSLRVPHEHWVETPTMRSEGAILTVENRISFARLDVETEALRGSTIQRASKRAATRIAMQYDHVGALGKPVIDVNSSRQRLELRRGQERWQAILHVELRKQRMVCVLALAPVRSWNGDKATIEALLDSLVVTD